MTQESRSTICSLVLPVSQSHVHSFLWPQWTCVRARFAWRQDMKIQTQKSLKEQCMACQGSVSSVLSLTLQS